MVGGPTRWRQIGYSRHEPWGMPGGGKDRPRPMSHAHRYPRHEVDEQSPLVPPPDRPSLRNIGEHLATLDRKIRHLSKMIAEPGHRSERARQFDRQERAALVVAVKALRYHQVTIRPETSPVVALRELIDEIDRLEIIGQAPDHDVLARIVVRSRRILDEVSS